MLLVLGSAAQTVRQRPLFSCATTISIAPVDILFTASRRRLMMLECITSSFAEIVFLLGCAPVVLF
jgi:hypothetical protein